MLGGSDPPNNHHTRITNSRMEITNRDMPLIHNPLPANLQLANSLMEYTKDKNPINIDQLTPDFLQWFETSYLKDLSRYNRPYTDDELKTLAVRWGDQDSLINNFGFLKAVIKKIPSIIKVCKN
jgi:hypothetical protein